MRPTPRSYYCAPQVNLERMAEAQAIIGMFEPNMNVSNLVCVVVGLVLSLGETVVK